MISLSVDCSSRVCDTDRCSTPPKVQGGALAQWGLEWNGDSVQNGTRPIILLCKTISSF